MSSWKKRSSPIVLQRILWPSGHPWEQPACADPRWFLCFGIRGGKSAMISPEHAILLMALGHGHPWTQPPNVMCGSVTWMVIRRMGGQNIIYIYGFGVNRRGLDELTHSQMTSQLLWYFDPDKQIPRNTYVSAGQETSTVESGSLVATVAMGGSKWGEVHWFEWCYVKSFYIWHRLYLQFDFVWFICYSRWQLNVGSM